MMELLIGLDFAQKKTAARFESDSRRKPSATANPPPDAPSRRSRWNVLAKPLQRRDVPVLKKETQIC